MWTEAHRARHDARLKEVVSLHAVGQVARWLERVAPPRSGRATPYGAVVRAIAWHLRVGGPWRALRQAGPQMAGAGAVRPLAGRCGPPPPPRDGPPGQASPEHHRHAVGQVHPGARATWVRCR